MNGGPHGGYSVGQPWQSGVLTKYGMKNLLKLLTRSGTRRIVALALSTIVTATLGITLDAEIVAAAVQVLVTVGLVATGDTETAGDMLDGLDRDPVLDQFERK